ncbi:MAG: methyltransferase [Bacteroidales bacterium]|nr:methyltransferase [Bacteroidales bacterium]
MNTQHDNDGASSVHKGKYDVFEYRQFTIRQTHAAMKVGTDSDLLGTLSQGGTQILDIGTGTGILSLMLAQRYPESRITAIEIDNDAILDARYNFEQSQYHNRISLEHISFQDYLEKHTGEETFDSIVCNPPYFDKSLECPNLGRARARHSSSLPFEVLIHGAYTLLQPDGIFSVNITPEVFDNFTALCQKEGFSLQNIYRIQTIPGKAPKRFILCYKKGIVDEVIDALHCMRNADGSRSEWYLNQLRAFLIVKV